MPDMSDKYVVDDAIDFLGVLETLWNGKWQIIAMILLFTCGAWGFSLTKQDRFTAVALIKPITSVEAEQYSTFNTLDFFNITPRFLLSLYIEQLQKKEVIKAAIRQEGLIDKDKFANEDQYEKAIAKLANSVGIQGPDSRFIVTPSGKKRRVKQEQLKEKGSWEIRFNYNDVGKLEKVLSYIFRQTNDRVRDTIQKRFEKKLFDNQLSRQFRREDLMTRITNAEADYQTETQKRLIFLAEQGAISRQLEISRNSLAAFDKNVPFYLRGYEAIEKEVSLIRARDLEQQKAFTKNLKKLQKEIRKLDQDKTLERAENLFMLTPVATGRDFLAAIAEVETVKFSPTKHKYLALIFFALMGAAIGIVYVLIANAFRERNRQAKQNT